MKQAKVVVLTKQEPFGAKVIVLCAPEEEEAATKMLSEQSWVEDATIMLPGAGRCLASKGPHRRIVPGFLKAQFVERYGAYFKCWYEDELSCDEDGLPLPNGEATFGFLNYDHCFLLKVNVVSQQILSASRISRWGGGLPPVDRDATMVFSEEERMVAVKNTKKGTFASHLRLIFPNKCQKAKIDNKKT